jgi:hypothetical protein
VLVFDHEQVCENGNLSLVCHSAKIYTAVKSDYLIILLEN